jgi:hypothetical protein
MKVFVNGLDDCLLYFQHALSQEIQEVLRSEFPLKGKIPYSEKLCLAILHPERTSKTHNWPIISDRSSHLAKTSLPLWQKFTLSSVYTP